MKSVTIYLYRLQTVRHGRHFEPQRRPTRRAFTLVELIVAMAIIGVVVVSLYAGITSGFASVRLARENLRATQILVEKMEAIRLYDWDQVTNNFIPTTFTVNYDPATTNVSSGIVYSGKVTLSKVVLGTSYDNDLRQVTVQVNWKTGGLARQRSINTYICRTGLQNYLY
jgi:uncharacterized protein (TIGR02598 family)